MYLLKMSRLRRALMMVTAAACLLVLASCGGGSDAVDVASNAEANLAADSEESADEDHGDEDHDEHGDDDHDKDEDHDDHGDEDHDDHDDHGDHDDTAGGFDAHVHGSAELFVAWSGTDVVVDLISPAINIVGFEYEPETDEDRAVAAERTDALARAGMLTINAQAGCELADDVEPNFEVEGTHAEVTASWLFTCDNPDEIKELDVSALFAEFPGLLDVDAQWASESAQSAAELSPTATVLRFE